MHRRPSTSAKRPLSIALAVCGLAWTTAAHAQLMWGAGGAGGAGAWDTTTANWWNGSSNVSWTAGSTAVFGGTGGIVTSFVFGPDVGGITFDAPGYTIQDGWINAANSTFTVTTNQAATINSTLSSSVYPTTFVKDGSATLTVLGTNFLDRVQVNAGEYLVSGTSDLFFSDVTLADAAGATVTLGQSSNSANIRSLSGGGATGGILRPDDQARTVTVTLWDTGTFRGSVQDNGNGKLALTIFAPNKVVTLAGTNTYSGATTVTAGTFALSENGSAPNTAMSVSSDGILRLDNR